MRAWGQRPDTFVCDEPLYAHYLHVTGLPHPAAAEVMASQPTDWRRVADWLTGPIPAGRSIWYQKHMAHHLLPSIDRGWLAGLSHAFLIRDPAEMLPSLRRILPEPRLDDTGLPQQVELFRRVCDAGDRVPPVVDARDILLNPAAILRLFCERLGVVYTDLMLHWPPGRRDTDGVWAPYWYGSVEQSTGFEPYQPKRDPMPPALSELHALCAPLYAELHAHRLQAAPTTPSLP